MEAELRLVPPPAGRAGEFENLLGRRDARVETFMPHRRRFGVDRVFEVLQKGLALSGEASIAVA